MPSKSTILFIGNSFTNRNDLPGTISALAAAADPPREVETARVIANGMSLKTHWERGEARRAIRERHWNYVVLQEQSTLPLKNRQKMHDYITFFDEEIRSHGAKTVLYLTWVRRNATERQDELTDAYATIGRKLGAIVVPVGVAWQRIWKEHPEIALHDRDKSHPNPAGSYLAACVFVATLFGTNRVGLPTDIDSRSKLEMATARTLQEAAWETVKAWVPSR